LEYRFRWLFGCGVFLFLISLAYFLSLQKEDKAKFSHLDTKGIFRVEIAEAPVEKAKSYLCEVKVLKFYGNGEWLDAHGNAILYVQKDSASSNLLFGDRLMVEAEFKKPPGAENPAGFNYAAYLKRQGIAATCYLPSRFVAKNRS